MQLSIRDFVLLRGLRDTGASQAAITQATVFLQNA